MREMKFWLYMAAKFSVAAGIVYVMLATLAAVYPLPEPLPARFGPPPPLFMHDMPFTFATLGIWLVGAGMVSLTLRDQRRRCRTCLRRLVMPVNSGSWGNMVIFGRPTTELICPFGHGTLSIDELQITGKQLPAWQPHSDNIWTELESYYHAQK